MRLLKGEIMHERHSPLDRYINQVGAGTVEWIGLRPRRREPLLSVIEAHAVAGHGLEGDHRMSKTPGSGRQVTLISQEFIDQIAAHMGLPSIKPARLRRNIVVSGINLNALRRQRFRVGKSLFEATQLCHPCARMEQELGSGGVVAMLGYGGLCARIIEAGVIACGDAVLPEPTL